VPAPASDEVTVATVASAVSHGTEMLVHRGEVPEHLELDLPTLRGSFRFPIKYGYASVGRVVERGAAVTRLAIGDLVFVHHPHQDRYTVPATLAIPVPPGVSPEAAALLANVETAVNVLLDAHPRLGEQAVVFGQGVVGLLVTVLLRRAGAEVVASVERHPLRRDLSRELGARAALEPGGDVADEVRRLTDGRGADLVLEASGNGEALGSALDCLAFQGTLVVCSWYGAKTVRVPLGDSFHRRRLRMVSSQVSSVDPALTPRWSVERRRALAAELLSELPLERLISHRVPFADAAQAYRLIAEQPQDTVQVILTYP
jgi:2-desacetyl-2-hydroxyethyl bacteriochlorophyllide A dehydrogenase